MTTTPYTPTGKPAYLSREISSEIRNEFQLVANAIDLFPDPEYSPNYAADSGTADVYAVTLAPVPAAYTAGMSVLFKATNANTGASTLNVNSLGAKSIKRQDGSALQANDIYAGAMIRVSYDGTNFQLDQNSLSAATSAAASAVTATTQAGIATTQAGNAAGSAASASSSAGTATTKAGEAAADRVQTGLDRIATAADAAQTALDRIATAADRVQTGLDRTAASGSASTATTQASNASASASAASISAGNASTSEANALAYAAKLTGTSVTTLTPSLAEKVVTTQSGKDFDAGTYVMLVSASNAAVWMYGPVTSYASTTLTFTPSVIGTATSKSDWVIAGRVGAQGPTGPAVTTIVGMSNTIAQFNTACSDADFAQLGANTFTGQQTFAETKDTVYGITDGAAFEIDPANGSVQTITLGASRTPKATNFEAGQAVLLGIDDGTAYTVTWTDGTLSPTWVKSGGTAAAPTLATSGYTWILLWKVSTTMYGAIVGSP